MLVRGETTEDRIAKIAQGFGQGFQNYQQGQNQKLAQANQAEATRRQQALQAFEIENKIAETTGRFAAQGSGQVVLSGMPTDIGAALSQPMTPKFEAAQKALELSNRATEARINKDNRAAAKAPELTYEQKLEKKVQKDAEVKVRQAQIADFEVANPSIIPSSKDAEEMKKLNFSNKNLQDAGKGLITKLGAITTQDRTGLTNNWKLIEQDLTQMALQGKELANLGALSGPDFELMNKDIGSISLASINTIGAKGAAVRIKAMIDRAQSKVHNAASARGYKPSAISVTSSLPPAHPQDNAAVQWAKQNPNNPDAAMILKANGAI